MAFCGNVLELVEKQKVLDDSEEFFHWNEIEGVSSEYPDIDVYIESSLIPELMEKKFLLIDAVVGEVKGGKIGLLFLKKENDVYG